MDSDYEGMPNLISSLYPDLISQNETVSVINYVNEYIPSYPFISSFIQLMAEEAEIENIKHLFEYSNSLDSVPVEFSEPYDGLSGEDFIDNEEAFVINDSWSFPLKKETFKLIFDNKLTRNPHHDEPIKRILKIRICIKS